MIQTGLEQDRISVDPDLMEFVAPPVSLRPFESIIQEDAGRLGLVAVALALHTVYSTRIELGEAERQTLAEAALNSLSELFESMVEQNSIMPGEIIKPVQEAILRGDITRSDFVAVWDAVNTLKMFQLDEFQLISAFLVRSSLYMVRVERTGIISPIPERFFRWEDESLSRWFILAIMKVLIYEILGKRDWEGTLRKI